MYPRTLPHLGALWYLAISQLQSQQGIQVSDSPPQKEEKSTWIAEDKHLLYGAAARRFSLKGPDQIDNIGSDSHFLVSALGLLVQLKFRNCQTPRLHAIASDWWWKPAEYLYGSPLFGSVWPWGGKPRGWSGGYEGIWVLRRAKDDFQIRRLDCHDSDAR